MLQAASVRRKLRTTITCFWYKEADYFGFASRLVCTEFALFTLFRALDLFSIPADYEVTMNIHLQ